MLRVNEIQIGLDDNVEKIKSGAAEKLGVAVGDFTHFEIVRESIDSRKKNNIKLTYSVDISLDCDEKEFSLKFNEKDVSYHEVYKYVCPENKRKSTLRPVIVGFGPAGMLSSLILCQAGLKPIVIERGRDVLTRTRDVNTFFTERQLNECSNVQFGEGGAGTFSDGKLNTGIKEPRTRQVLLEFVKHGAPDEILYSARPHIGTDKLATVVKNIREDIIEMGADVRFGEKLVNIYSANGFVHGVSVEKNDGSVYDIETDCVLLCIGHSARDTVKMLWEKGICMQAKPFSIGTRIEHPQSLINRAQYGDIKHPKLSSADYKLSNHPLHGRGAYTFCMCPGGTVVNAASESGEVVTNGMSVFARDGENANSAILVGIDPDFFYDANPLAGIEFQRMIERKAFKIGGGDYTAPAQRVVDFLNGRPSKKMGSVHPTCPTGVTPSSMEYVLPGKVTDEIANAIRLWDNKLHGFAFDDAVLTFPESRSSSPVRILRDDFYQTNIRGLFPCGEGAGYAGGIVSAAADGIKCAEAVLSDES